MGTSQSSNGSPSGVPMVPPWVPDIQQNEAPEKDNAQNMKKELAREPLQPTIAPRGRFSQARTNLGDFARGGDSNQMKRGLGHYVKNGYGGSKTATQRMGGTARTAQVLFNVLSLSSDFSQQSNFQLDLKILQGKNADEVMDALVEAIAPIDGSLDSEASRFSVKSALSEVLERFPEADLTNLDNFQREYTIELFISEDVFRRIDLDIGKTVREKAPSALASMKRMKEIKDYVRETIASSFRSLKQQGQNLEVNNISKVVSSAIKETFEIFEGYAL